jgi:hypothetical protein
MSATRDAIERLAHLFAESPTRPGLLARAALERPARGDAELRDRLAARLRDETRSDGSVGGAALPTIWRVHELLDLGVSGDDPAVRRVVGWVMSLQGRPGAFGEGCAEPRHQHRACEHWLTGFFSPASPEQRVAPITFPNGKVFRAEPAARFAVSCLALRAAVRAGHQQAPAVQAHLIGLGRLESEWDKWGSYYTPDLVASGLAGLSGASAPHAVAAHRVGATIAAHQEPDGTWAQADLFHVLESLIWADSGAARTALRRAAPALIARQRPDGSFPGPAREERAWIGLRSLLAAVS